MPPPRMGPEPHGTPCLRAWLHVLMLGYSEMMLFFRSFDA